MLRDQKFGKSGDLMGEVFDYARAMAEVENVVAVVSDLLHGNSRIFAGRFADTIGLGEYQEENSIWERAVLSLMDDEERELKFMAEIRFLNYLRRQPRNRRGSYCLMTGLRFKSGIDVLHRMYYIYDKATDSVRYAICLYGPMLTDVRGRSLAVNTVTGVSEQLTGDADDMILSRRERQIITMINDGMTSEAIARTLCISKHTVSRHRQQILSKLQCRNSIEACRAAKALNIL
ncbi:MAG: helix-turn-helix transcriptional regulator [Bacteroidales bacterium]|nr:helix-turn-helix transcriptional regulator [Bacteroidales bacterium]